MKTELPKLPERDECVKIDLDVDVLPEYLEKHGMHIQEVTKDLVLILEPKKEHGHE